MQEDTLGWILARWSLRSVATESGEKYWELFLQMAQESNVPSDFAEASVKILKRGDTQRESASDIWVEGARHLLEVELKPDEAVYAVCYCLAIASIKLWRELEEGYATALARLEEAEDKYRETLAEIGAAHLHCDTSTALEITRQHRPRLIVEATRELEEKISSWGEQVASVKAAAQQFSGSVVLCEERASPPKDFSLRALKQRLVRAIRRRPGLRDLARVRAYAEEYFSDPGKHARIVLLASSRYFA